MFGRRPPAERFNRRGIGASGGVGVTALSFVTSGVLQYVRADLGITLNGSRVSAWADQSGQAKDYTQGTGANQSLYNATGGPNGRAIVSTDDVNRFMSSTLALPIRTTTPTTMWIVGRQVSWANGRRIVSDTTNLKKLLLQDTTTPQVDLYDGGNVGNNAGGTLGSFARIIADWTATVGDCRLKIGASNVTALNPGASAADVGRLLGNSVGASAIFDFCEVLHMNRALTGQEESDLDTIYIPGRYGPGNVLV